MERLYSVIATEYISNISYLPKVLLTVSRYWGPDRGMVGVGQFYFYYLVISGPKVWNYAKFEKYHFQWNTALKNILYYSGFLRYLLWMIDSYRKVSRAGRFKKIEKKLILLTSTI